MTIGTRAILFLYILDTIELEKYKDEDGAKACKKNTSASAVSLRKGYFLVKITTLACLTKG